MKIKKFKIGLTWVLILIAAFTLLLITTQNGEAKTITVDDDGGEDFTNIQDAIDFAEDGDTVYVYAGTYYENVKVDKSITLEGEYNETTIIDGGGNEDTVLIDADGVNMSNFSIRNSGYEDWGDSGIGIASEYNQIYNNIIFENDNGIYLYQSSNNELWNNNVSNNVVGIMLHESGNNMVVNNTASYNEFFGISLLESYNSKIENNTCSYNDDHIDWDNERDAVSAGILIADNSYDISINYNNIFSNVIGIAFAGDINNYAYKNNIRDHWIGFWFGDSKNTIITGNNINYNDNGMWIGDSQNQNIIDNNISSNKDVAIILENSDNINIRNNIITNNGDGIIFDNSPNVLINGNNISFNKEDGILCNMSFETIIENNIISKNRASGIASFDSSPTIINNELDSNYNFDILSISENPTIKDNDFTINNNPDYKGRITRAWWSQIKVVDNMDNPIPGAYITMDTEEPLDDFFNTFTEDDGYIYSDLFEGNTYPLTEYVVDKDGTNISHALHKINAKIGDSSNQVIVNINENKTEEKEIVIQIDFKPTLVESAYTEIVPTIDGVFSPDEWDDATKISKEFESMFVLNNSFAETHEMDLYFKNDGDNLYIGLKISDDDNNHSGDDFDAIHINFDDPHDGIYNEGEDQKAFPTIYDGFYDENHRDNDDEEDVNQGGTQDGTGVILYQSEYYLIEISVPLNSGDSLDIQTNVGDVIGFNIAFLDNIGIIDDDYIIDNLSIGGWSSSSFSNATYWGDLKIGTPPPPQQPDFKITESDINFIDNEGKKITEPIEGEKIGIEAVIQNIGNLNGSAKVKFYDGEPNGNNLIYEKEINVDKESNYSVQYVWIATIGEHDIYVVISESNPEESNINNNQAHRIINIHQPDLTVLNITIKDKDGKEISELIEGKNYTIEVTIQNKGKVKATATIKFYLEFLGENIKIGENNITIEKNSSITLPIEWIAIEGKHEIIVEISNSIPEESNTENNQASVSIEVVGEDDDNGGFIPGFESHFTAISLIGVGALVAFFRRRNGVREI